MWDLCHYGWPGWLDIWSPEFITAFARYAAEAADLVCRISGAGFYCVINEISFWAGPEERWVYLRRLVTKRARD